MKRIIICFLLFTLNMFCLYANNRIIVSKSKFEIIVVTSQSDTICRYSCGVGLNVGNKEKFGDKKTPEGQFKIVSIENSSKWTHDFNDGYGERQGAYGPYFIRLRTPGFSGIGIHGTCFPESIGTRCSDGCIRINNRDLAELVSYCKVGMYCIIEK